MMTPYNEAWIETRDEWLKSGDRKKNLFILSQQIDKVLTNRFAPGRWHRTLAARDKIDMRRNNLWIKYATNEGLNCGTIRILDKDFKVTLYKDPADDKKVYLKLVYGKKITDKNPYVEGNYIELSIYPEVSLYADDSTHKKYADGLSDQWA